MCAQTKDCLCNYTDSSRQKAAEINLQDSTVTIEYHKLSSEAGELDTDVIAKITLRNDEVLFSAELINNSDSEISEFWFPQIGGITRFDENRDAKMAVPAYVDCRHSMNPIKDFPGALRLGSIAAEWCATYPGIVMPWIDIHDPVTDRGFTSVITIQLCVSAAGICICIRTLHKSPADPCSPRRKPAVNRWESSFPMSGICS